MDQSIKKQAKTNWKLSKMIINLISKRGKLETKGDLIIIRNY